MSTELVAAEQTTLDHELAGALRCATWGHAWYEFISDWVPMVGTPMTVRCERCGRERRDSLNRHGEVISRHYWPKKPRLSYTRAARPSRADFRVMLLVQRINEAREART